MATVDLGTYKAEILLDDSKFTSKMSAAERDIRNFESGAGRWGSRLGALATGAIAGLGASIAAVGTMAVKTGVDFNAMKEQSEIAWTTLLGSADEAKKTINDLVQLGAKTPFEFEGLDKSAKLLNMAGFEGEKLKETLIAVGDAVSAVGGGQEELEGVSMALFQMSAKGKASAEEMNQLAERGIPAWEILSETMGKPIPELMKMSEQGKLMANQVIPALVKGMGERFGGAMEKQSQTFNGLMSTLKDNLKSFTAMITSDLFEKIKSFLPTIIDFVNRISDAFKNAGWKGVIQEILPPQVASSITQNIGILKQIISDFVAFGKDIWKKYGDEISATAKASWQTISQTIKGLLEIIRGVIKTVLSLISGDWKGAWEGIKSIAKGVWDTIGGFIKNATNGIQNIIKASLEIVKNIFSTVWNGIKTLVSTIWNSIKSTISTTLNGISSNIQSIWNNIKNAISNTLNSIKTTVSNIWNGIKSSISSTIHSISSIVSSVFNSVKSNVSSIFNSIKSTALSVWNGIKSSISTAVNTAKSAVSSAFSSMKSAVSSIMSGIKSIITSMWNSAVSFLKGINLFSIGKDIIQGLINGISSMVGSIKKRVEEIARNIPAWAKKILGIRSPSRVMMEVGQWTTIGFAKGIESKKKDVEKSSKKTAEAAKKAFEEQFKSAQYNFKIGKIDESQYISKLRTILKEYAKTSDQIRKVNLEIKKIQDEQAKKTAEIVKKTFEQGKQAIEYQKQIRNVSLEQELQWWNNLAKLFKKGTKERMEAEKEYARVKDEITKRNFENEKRWFEEKKYYNQLSLMQELESLNTVAKRYKQGTEERIYWEKEIYRVKKEISDRIAQINDEYVSKIEEANKRLADSEKQLTEEYQRAVDERAKSLYSFAGLFDEIKIDSNVTGEQLLKNLEDQVKAFEEWQRNIQILVSRGLDKGLIEELQDLGPKAYAEIQALTTLSDSQLQEYAKLWKEKHELAKDEATKELEGLKTETQNKIQELRKETAKELEQYKAEWIKKIQEIKTGTQTGLKDWKTSMKTIGMDAIQGLIDGMKSMTGSLQTQAKEIANVVSKTIKDALKIKSPSRVMMEVGNFISEGLAIGMNSQSNLVEKASNNLANKVLAIPNTLSFSLSTKRGSLGLLMGRNSQTNSTVHNEINLSPTFQFSVNGTLDKSQAEKIADITIERMIHKLKPYGFV
ncbi:tape measure protein [Geobacillus sp. B4113_201601]|uniref:tape measure protein n=1 Tax=Geobacillus sp. B4113_201601 TaxID=1586290 RepID=UPI0007838E55|nr:tape measure protein [Geobacillus sp. B4113_201601]